MLLLSVGHGTRDCLCLGAAWLYRLVGVVVMEYDLQVLLGLHWDWVVHDVGVSALHWLHDRTVLVVTTRVLIVRAVKRWHSEGTVVSVGVGGHEGYAPESVQCE